MGWSARRLNALGGQLGSRRYLEIGVSTGETFHEILCDERTGVDPQFGFDIKPFVNAKTYLFEQTSDAYFRHTPISPPFDLVFIDGLHTFEQVVRDFANAITRTHQRTAILLDDTVPDDIYSSLKDIPTSVRHREMAGNLSESWHGDVFKAVFYLHDFWPSLNFRTIVGSGNEQTLVWHSVTNSRRPLFDDLEKISRMSYFDMKDSMQAMHPCGEEEAIALCVEEITAH